MLQFVRGASDKPNLPEGCEGGDHGLGGSHVRRIRYLSTNGGKWTCPFSWNVRHIHFIRGHVAIFRDLAVCQLQSKEVVGAGCGACEASACDHITTGKPPDVGGTTARNGPRRIDSTGECVALTLALTRAATLTLTLLTQNLNSDPILNP